MSNAYGELGGGIILDGQFVKRVGVALVGATPTPGPHAPDHAIGGPDALTPAAIGAATAAHNHDAAYAAKTATDAHVASTANPHATTAAQVGAATAGHDHAGVYAAIGHSHAATDPWTTVRLGSDFVSSSASNVNVTGLSFTPTASKRYLVRVILLLRTATATVGPRPGFAWPTGLDDGSGRVDVPNSATALAVQCFPTMATANAAGTGLVNTTASHLSIGDAYFITGASPSGAFQVTLASETAATNVTVRAGSFLQWREIP